MPRAEYKFFGIKLNSDKDGDMICFLQSKKNKQEFIKDIIRREMMRDTRHMVKQSFKEWEERMSKK